MENIHTDDHLTYGAQGDSAESVEIEKNNETESSFDTEAAAFPQTTNPMMSRLRSKGLSRNYNTGMGPSSKKKPTNGPKQKSKAPGRKYASSKPVAQRFASKQAREEITKYEELKNKATSNLNAVYDEIRPEIEAHGSDSQDKVPTSIAGKWMDATCDKWKTYIDFSFSIIKNVMFPTKSDASTEATSSQVEGDYNEIKEYNHLWEEGDDRNTVENVPLYDSAEEDPFPASSSSSSSSYEMTANHLGGIKLEAATTTEYHLTNDVKGEATESVKTERNNETKFSFNTQAAAFSQKTDPMISRNQSNSASGINYKFGAGPSSKKRPAKGPKQKAKAHGKKYVSSKPIAQMFASKQAREEITKYEELKNKATSKLNAVYNEIRPAIEAHEMDSQDNVPTSVADKWMDATCDKWKADIGFSFSIIKNVMFPPKSDDSTEATGSQVEEDRQRNKAFDELSNSL